MSVPLPMASRPAPVPPDVTDRLRRWVRVVAGLGEDDVVTVTQLACRDSGCAPVETVLAVLRPGAPLHRTLPLPAEQVSVADVRAAFGPAPDGVSGRRR